MRTVEHRHSTDIEDQSAVEYNSADGSRIVEFFISGRKLLTVNCGLGIEVLFRHGQFDAVNVNDRPKNEESDR